MKALVVILMALMVVSCVSRETRYWSQATEDLKQVLEQNKK